PDWVSHRFCSFSVIAGATEGCRDASLLGEGASMRGRAVPRWQVVLYLLSLFLSASGLIILVQGRDLPGWWWIAPACLVAGVPPFLWFEVRFHTGSDDDAPEA